MKTVLITGATDGIGLELARLFHGLGYRLVLVGRKSLASLSGHHSGLFSKQTYIRSDLSIGDCANLIVQGLNDLQIEFLDLVIHNAGGGYVGELSEQSPESIEAVFAVNLLAPILITRELLSRMTPGSGKLVFISSIVTALPTPKFAVYGATKAALDGFCRSLRVELEGRVQVQVIHPGATKTGMHRKAGLNEKVTRKFAKVDLVAQQILRSIMGSKRSVTIGWRNRLIRTAGSFLEWEQVVRQALVRKSPHSLPRDNRVLVTGGADGIGKALVEEYTQAASHVHFVDADQVRSEQLQIQIRETGGYVEITTQDLLTPHFEWLNTLSPLDVFVHNAGINATGHFCDQDVGVLERVLRLNLLIPFQVTAKLLKMDLLKPQGSLVLMSSLSHFCSYPGASVYAASKDGLAHYGLSLASVLKNGRSVLTVFPGPTRTAHARLHSPDNRREAKRMDPKVLVREIYNAERLGKRYLIPGLAAKMMTVMGLFAPRSAEFLMKRVILDKFERPLDLGEFPSVDAQSGNEELG